MDLLAKGSAADDRIILRDRYYGFGTAKQNPADPAKGGWFLVNTSGRIQTGTKSGTKDGYDMYWFMSDDNIKFYADDKNVSDIQILKIGRKTTNDICILCEYVLVS